MSANPINRIQFRTGHQTRNTRGRDNGRIRSLFLMFGVLIGISWSSGCATQDHQSRLRSAEQIKANVQGLRKSVAALEKELEILKKTLNSNAPELPEENTRAELEAEELFLKQRAANLERQIRELQRPLRR